MPLVLPPSPSIDQVEAYNGKNWQWNGSYWSAVSQYQQAIPNTFQTPIVQDYYEALVTTAPNTVNNMAGVLLTYL